jgi:hypothetical protein
MGSGMAASSLVVQIRTAIGNGCPVGATDGGNVGGSVGMKVGGTHSRVAGATLGVEAEFKTDVKPLTITARDLVAAVG